MGRNNGRRAEHYDFVRRKRRSETATDEHDGRKDVIEALKQEQNSSESPDEPQSSNKAQDGKARVEQQNNVVKNSSGPDKEVQDDTPFYTKPEKRKQADHEPQSPFAFVSTNSCPIPHDISNWETNVPTLHSIDAPCLWCPPWE